MYFYFNFQQTDNFINAEMFFSVLKPEPSVTQRITDILVSNKKQILQVEIKRVYACSFLSRKNGISEHSSNFDLDLFSLLTLIEAWISLFSNQFI